LVTLAHRRDRASPDLADAAGIGRRIRPMTQRDAAAVAILMALAPGSGACA